jgi:hypothetical protein
MWMKQSILLLIVFAIGHHSNADRSKRDLGDGGRHNADRCSTELKEFRIWNVDTEEYEVLENGDEICKTGDEITIEAYYGDCVNYDRNPIKKVVMKHYVNNELKTEQNECVAPYYLYGNEDDELIGKDPIKGTNKVTAKVRTLDRWLSEKSRTFTVMRC